MFLSCSDWPQDPFETLEYDLPTIKEAARRALGRYTLGMSSVGYFKTLQDLLHHPIGATAEEKATQAEELTEAFQAFLKFFTSAKTKVSDYEHPKRMEEWNGSRLDISKRFSKAGIAPKGHPWCPQVCSTVLAQSPIPMARTDVPESAEYAKLVQWATKRDTRSERTERTKRTEGTKRMERMERMKRMERMERAERMERMERIERIERTKTS